MPTADIFASLGLYMCSGFLDPETCGQLREAVRRAPSSPVTVRQRGRDTLDRSRRSTGVAEVPRDAVAVVEERLTSVMPQVEHHYGLSLDRFEPLQFLVYREGDFFLPHSDGADSDDAPDYLRARRVAAVIFLSGEGDPTTVDGFRGGALTFYGLFDQTDADDLGLPLKAEEGLLTTFPADMVHEVLPVEAGERFTIVTWFAGD